MNRRARALTLLFLAWAAGAPMAEAWADTVPNSNKKPPATSVKGPSKKELEAKKQDAKKKFLEGREALNRGEYLSALALFRTSQELYASPGTLLNLALCEERLGMLGTAYLHFQEVQKLVPADDERSSIANTGALSLEPRVPKLRIGLAKNAPEGTVVSLAGRELKAEEFGKDQYLDPGKAVVVVSAPGRPDRIYEAALVEGKRTVLQVEPGALPEPEVKPPPAPTAVGALPGGPSGPLGIGAQPILPAAKPDMVILPPDPRLRMAAYIAGGAGALGLLVGGVSGIVALVKKNEVDSACPDPKYCSEEGLSAERTGKAFAAASTIGFSVGAVGAAAGITLWVLSAGGPAPPEKPKVGLSNTSVFMGPDMGGIHLEGHF